jgi:hypothetical protein
MNNLAVAFLTALIVISSPSYAADAPNIKTVCRDVKNKNGKLVKDVNGKIKQTCKKVRIHKKFKGTRVPDKKSKK